MRGTDNAALVFLRVFGGDTVEEKARLIEELEREERNPFITVRLSDVQIKALAEYIVMLPFRDFQPLMLYYCFYYTEKRLRRETGIEKVNGHREYLKDRLTQCMELGRPIAERYWRSACSSAVDIYMNQARKKDMQAGGSRHVQYETTSRNPKRRARAKH